MSTTRNQTQSVARPAPYVRVYASIIDDERFETVYDNDRDLATWLRLLLTADATYPSPAPIPAGVNRNAFAHLVARGIVEEVRGHRYRIHGLAAERERRAVPARLAAAARWGDREQYDGNADALPDDSGSAYAAEPSRAEPSRAEPNHPQPPHSGGDLTNPRAAGTNPRAVARRRRIAKDDRAALRRLARDDGQISETEFAELERRDAVPPKDRPRGYAYQARPERIGDVLGRMAAGGTDDES